MRRALLVVVAALAVAAAVPVAQGESRKAAAVREVSMPSRVFAPGRLQVLLGDTVVWRNADSTNHTVTSDDDRFDSGYIAPGLTFAQAFTKAGRYLYHCTIHRFMRGEIVVVPVALSAPTGAVVSGGRVVLQGFAPSGSGRVTLMRVGSGRKVVGRVVPAGDGSFTVPLRVYTPADFEALAKGLASPHVHVAVAPRVLARRSGGEVRVSASPKRPGARAVLQRYVRERFLWQTVTGLRLGPSSKAVFPLPPKPGRFRVVVRGSHGWADGVSGTIVVGRR
jgi:plastocyanin